MSVGFSLAEAAALNLTSAVFIRPRNIAGRFFPNVTIEERHEDELVITEHPVEQGAEITDHSYKKPNRLSLHVGWSNSSIQAFGNPIYIDLMYAQFIAMQESRVPFSVLTGKRRLYTNMLARRVSVTTDEKTEDALMMTVECQEIIIAQTQVVSVPPAANMKAPQKNSAPLNVGPQALSQAPNFNA